MAGHQGAGKLEQGESDDHGRQKEGEGMPDRRVGVSRKRAGSMAFVRGGLTATTLQSHCNEIRLTVIVRNDEPKDFR